MVGRITKDEMVSDQQGWSEPLPDPVALLKREHQMISDQLGMIEALLERHAETGVAKSPPEPHRETLRELLRFFTTRVGVHFRREAVLVATLRRVLGRPSDVADQLTALLREHRLLRAEAAVIIKKLDGKLPSAGAGADRYGIRSFVRHYRRHLAREEQSLYVLATTRLTDDQKLYLSRRILQV
jgi:hemerythrin-like domain-containing protein